MRYSKFKPKTIGKNPNALHHYINRRGRMEVHTSDMSSPLAKYYPTQQNPHQYPKEFIESIRLGYTEYH